MSKKPESRLQLAIQHRLRSEFPDCYVRKIHGNEFTPAGMPDLVCCVKGIFIGLEVKALGAKMTPLQENEAKEIIKAGGSCYMISSTDEAVKCVHWAIRNVLD